MARNKKPQSPPTITDYRPTHGTVRKRDRKQTATTQLKLSNQLSLSPSLSARWFLNKKGHQEPRDKIMINNKYIEFIAFERKAAYATGLGRVAGKNVFYWRIFALDLTVVKTQTFSFRGKNVGVQIWDIGFYCICEQRMFGRAWTRFGWRPSGWQVR